MSDTNQDLTRNQVMNLIPLLAEIQDKGFPLRVSIAISRCAEVAKTYQEEISEAVQKYAAEHAKTDEEGNPLFEIEPRKAIRNIAQEQDDPEAFLENIKDDNVGDVLSEHGVPEYVPMDHPSASNMPAFEDEKYAQEYRDELTAYTQAPCEEDFAKVPEDLQDDFLAQLEDIFGNITPQQAYSLRILL